MAIEFHCPYCTATIRVPDEFSGKRGSCPKCATKLLVPDIVPHGSHPPETSILSPAGPLSNEAEVGSAAAADVVPADVPTIPAADESVPMSRRLKRRQRRGSNRLYSMGIPLLCFGAFLGLLALVMVMRAPELKGTLRGSVATAMELPRVMISPGTLEVSASEAEQALQVIQKSPETLVSPQMTCTIIVDEGRLAVDVREGSGFVWCAVNPAADPTLSQWIRENRVWLNELRLERTAKAGGDFCRDRILRANGDPLALDAERYRDEFVLNSRVDAFGFAVEGIADQRRLPCAHEDTNGTLFFAIPEGTSSFTLRGRTVSGGAPLFPGEYQVQVTSDSPPPAPSSAETPVDPEPEPSEPAPISETPEPAPMSETPLMEVSNAAVHSAHAEFRAGFSAAG
ncbi:MAG: hypothetical protein R3C49_19105 [Planctomycetaceae bacterium]